MVPYLKHQLCAQQFQTGKRSGGLTALSLVTQPRCASGGPPCENTVLTAYVCSMAARTISKWYGAHCPKALLFASSWRPWGYLACRLTMKEVTRVPDALTFAEGVGPEDVPRRVALLSAPADGVVGHRW